MHGPLKSLSGASLMKSFVTPENSRPHPSISKMQRGLSPNFSNAPIAGLRRMNYNLAGDDPAYPKAIDLRMPSFVFCRCKDQAFNPDDFSDAFFKKMHQRCPVG